MCGRYVQAKTTLELAEEFDAVDKSDPGATQPSWNVAPTMELPTIVRREDERQLRVMRWGLVPSWAKDLAVGTRLINARAETLPDKPAFRSAVARRRCLVPADGWYEWMALDPGPGGKSRKQPFWFAPADGAQLAFAGLFEHWKDRTDPDARWVSSFTVVTTSTTDALGVVHDRSPVLLAPDDWDRWLDTTEGTTIDAALGLLRPIDPGAVVGRPVSPAVGNVKNDDPHLLDPLPVE